MSNITEGCRLELMNVRALSMRPIVDTTDPTNPITTGFMLTPEGEQDIVNIWETSCASMNWPDITAFRQNVINDANATLNDPLQPQVGALINSSIVGNNANATQLFRPLTVTIAICFKTWWFSFYIWLHV